MAIAVALAMVPAKGYAQSPPPATPGSTPTSAPSGQSTATWGGKLTVERCRFAAPALPAETEIALNATLIVRVPEGVGSAVLISPDGFALTAAHVVQRHPTVSLVTRAGTTLSATVVRVDEAHDVALIKIPAPPGPTPCLAPVEGQVPLGSDVFVLGSPAGEELSFSVAKGIVSGYRTLDGLRFVQFDAAVNPGNSGGPAVSESGQIVGITSWKLSHVSLEGLSFAVPGDVALSVLDVELGDASSQDWAAQTGRRDFAPNTAPTRAPGASPYGPPPDPQQQRRQRIKRGLIAGGSVSLGLGVMSVAITGGYYYTAALTDGISPSRWTALQAANTVGWTLAGIGAGLLIVGLVIPKKPKKAASASLQIVPTSNGAVLQGSF